MHYRTCGVAAFCLGFTMVFAACESDPDAPAEDAATTDTLDVVDSDSSAADTSTTADSSASDTAIAQDSASTTDSLVADTGDMDTAVADTDQMDTVQVDTAQTDTAQADTVQMDTTAADTVTPPSYGKADLVSVFPQTSAPANASVYLSDGARFADPVNWRSPQSTGGTFESGDHTFLADVDGDGDADLVTVSPNTNGPANASVYLSDGARFADPVNWRAPNNTGGTFQSGDHTFLADVDGDGDADLVTISPNANGPANASVYLSDGARFLDPVNWRAPNNTSGTFQSGDHTFLADVDGDGDADLVTVSPNANGPANASVYLSDGSRFLDPVNWRAPNNTAGTFESGDHTFLADVDGDGAADLVTVFPETNAPANARVYLSDGTKFLDSVNWRAPQNTGGTFQSGDHVFLADVDGL